MREGHAAPHAPVLGGHGVQHALEVGDIVVPEGAHARARQVAPVLRGEAHRLHAWPHTSIFINKCILLPTQNSTMHYRRPAASAALALGKSQ